MSIIRLRGLSGSAIQRGCDSLQLQPLHEEGAPRRSSSYTNLRGPYMSVQPPCLARHRCACNTMMVQQQQTRYEYPVVYTAPAGMLLRQGRQSARSTIEAFDTVGNPPTGAFSKRQIDLFTCYVRCKSRAVPAVHAPTSTPWPCRRVCVTLHIDGEVVFNHSCSSP